MNLKEIYSRSNIAYQDIKQYCEQEVGFRGYGSLKYCIMRLQDFGISGEELIEVFSAATEELNARGENPLTAKRLWRLEAFEPWRKQLKQREKLDLRWLEDIYIGGHLVIVNETDKNLTSKIFRELPDAEAILFVNGKKYAWGVVFRIGSEMHSEQDKIASLLQELRKAGFSPVAIGEPVNLILYGGKNYGLEADGMTTDQLISFLKKIWS